MKTPPNDKIVIVKPEGAPVTIGRKHKFEDFRSIETGNSYRWDEIECWIPLDKMALNATKSVADRERDIRMLMSEYEQLEIGMVHDRLYYFMIGGVFAAALITILLCVTGWV